MNRFLCHKTTHRAVYDRHREEHPFAFDVLLWNERGEITEFTIGNFVAEIDGERVTPPRDCGLLGGVFRQELLDRGEVAERTILHADLGTATRMWLINSVREWVEVSITPNYRSA
jgi:para-aminobenzoate synthetase/4-amino-4-deoxychorismate lyase